MSEMSDLMHVGSLEKRIHPASVFDPEDPHIKEDMIRMITQYLQKEGYSATAMTLQDETSIKLQDHSSRRAQFKRVRKAVLEGDWETTRKLATRHLLRRNHRPFLYEVYRQEYLELIERQELQRAFIYLTKRLKPFESLSRAQGSEEEFADLCYLLTCKSVQDAPSFRNWDGVVSSRERLAEQLQSMLESDTSDTALSFGSRHGGHGSGGPGSGRTGGPGGEGLSGLGGGAVHTTLQPDRLVNLMQQAVSYQMEFSRYHPRVAPRVRSLLSDYRCLVVPDEQYAVFEGHLANVKCVEWIGTEGLLLASGSSDHSIKLWNVDEIEDGDDGEEDTGNRAALGSGDNIWTKDRRRRRKRTRQQQLQGTSGCSATLSGHRARIWDLTSDRTGRWLVSASGDGSVRLWDLHKAGAAESAGAPVDGGGGGLVDEGFIPLRVGHEGDVYSVHFHPGQNHVVTAGYDKTVRLGDVRRGGKVVKSFYGHSASVTHAVFNPHGNIVATGSKDCTIKLWDVLSGVCIKTYTQLLGEVTSLELSENGHYLLSR